MSRTKHHKGQRNQHVGEDLWSRRAGMGNSSYCAYSKRLTARKERMECKQELVRNIDTVIDDVEFDTMLVLGRCT